MSVQFVLNNAHPETPHLFGPYSRLSCEDDISRHISARYLISWMKNDTAKRLFFTLERGTVELQLAGV